MNLKIMIDIVDEIYTFIIMQHFNNLRIDDNNINNGEILILLMIL